MLRRALQTAAVLALGTIAAALPGRPAEAQTTHTVGPGWLYIPGGHFVHGIGVGQRPQFKPRV